MKTTAALCFKLFNFQDSLDGYADLSWLNSDLWIWRIHPYWIIALVAFCVTTYLPNQWHQASKKLNHPVVPPGCFSPFPCICCILKFCLPIFLQLQFFCFRFSSLRYLAAVFFFHGGGWGVLKKLRAFRKQKINNSGWICWNPVVNGLKPLYNFH